MGYAFISYSSKNLTQATAMRDLLQHDGIETWMAPGDIPLGKQYGQVITDALRNCSCMLLMLSNEPQHSQFVSKEVERIVSYRKPIIAAQLDQIGLINEFEYYLSDTQLIAIQKIDKDSDEVRRIVDAVKIFCSEGPAKVRKLSEPSPVSAQQKEPEAKKPGIRKDILIAFLALILVLCGIIIWLCARPAGISSSQTPAMSPAVETLVPGDSDTTDDPAEPSPTEELDRSPLPKNDQGLVLRDLYSTRSQPGYGPDNLFDGDPHSKWVVKSEGPFIVEWSVREPIRPKYFVLQSCDDSSINTGRNPKTASLLARFYSWDDWTEIWHMMLPPDDTDLQRMINDISGSVKSSYAYYRLVIDETTGGGDILQLAEIELIPEGGSLN